MQILRKNYYCKSNQNEIGIFHKAKKSISAVWEVDFFIYLPPQKAQMVKLVDTLVSGTSDRKVVQVRVLFWAQFENQRVRKYIPALFYVANLIGETLKQTTTYSNL